MIKLDKTEQKRKLNAPYTGPYRLLKVYNNGTVKINCGLYEKNFHIHRLKPNEKEKGKRKRKRKGKRKGKRKEKEKEKEKKKKEKRKKKKKMKKKEND